MPERRMRVEDEIKRSRGGDRTRLDASPPGLELPPLEGEDLEAGEAERQRFVRLMFGWKGPWGLDADVAGAIRKRAMAILEHEAEARYWVEGAWRWEVFGWSRAARKRVAWTPSSLVRLEIDVQRPLAGVWAMAAWAEGQELEEWVWTCANLWTLELARVADEGSGRPEGRPADGLYRLADEALERGEHRTAAILSALGLVLGVGDCEEVVAELLMELAGTVAGERLAHCLDPSTARPTVGALLHLINRAKRRGSGSVRKEIGPSKNGEDQPTGVDELLRGLLCRGGCIDPDG